MIDLFFGEYLSRRIERWVRAGRRVEARPAADGLGFILEHGPRVRAFWGITAAVFGAFLALGLWAHRTQAIGSFWFMIGYVAMFGGAFVLSASMLLAVMLTWVRVDHRGVAEPRLGGGQIEIGWPEVAEVRFSALWESFLIRARDGRTLRISAHLDGLGRLREALQRHAAMVAPPAVLVLLPSLPSDAS
ncbi:MAG: hypothetical protein DMF80_12160 [Acidobacteria bacterium]|nr:MAG: hypothetical protein DMF80_12160 [Acidobacteriota bacterium]PYQ23606.1 MAG: hypothetical protein DMF81_08315 [Acidobacteriota bacterium]